MSKLGSRNSGYLKSAFSAASSKTGAAAPIRMAAHFSRAASAKPVAAQTARMAPRSRSPSVPRMG